MRLSRSLIRRLQWHIQPRYTEDASTVSAHSYLLLKKSIDSHFCPQNISTTKYTHLIMVSHSTATASFSAYSLLDWVIERETGAVARARVHFYWHKLAVGVVDLYDSAWKCINHNYFRNYIQGFSTQSFLLENKPVIEELLHTTKSKICAYLSQSVHDSFEKCSTTEGRGKCFWHTICRLLIHFLEL